MKRSELKQQIEEIITELLNEVDVEKTAGAVQVKKGTAPGEIKKFTSQGIDVNIVPENNL